jgi:PAS domain S-box-containing protein
VETKLNHDNEKYRLITEHTSDLIAITTFTVNPVYTYISPSHKRAIGYDPEDLIGKSSFDLIHPDDRKKLLPLLTKYISQKVKGLLTGKELEIFETVQFRVRDKAGNWHYLESTVNLVHDELLFISRDVTERNRAEDELRESTRFLSNILSSIQDGITILDPEMNILMVNPVMKQWYAHAIPLVGRKCYEAYHGRHEHCNNCPSYHTINTGNPGHAVVPRVGSDGETTGWLDLYSFPLRDVSTGAFVGIIEYARDISNQKLMEKEMQKVEKLESLGILAGGIAHDFNNILTVILGNVSLAKMPGRCDEKIIKRLTDAEKACERAKDLTQQLLTFAKGGTPIKKTAAIAELIRDTAGFALRGSNVRSEVSIAEDLWAVDVDEGQISQVIHNLVINADQAMPQGGVLKLRAENMRIDANKAIPLPEGNYIAIAIIDQGVGIPKEYVAKIFDPFFTTKQKGSGLGLASSYSIISNHGGHITVESAPGIGSTFTFYLPASEKKIENKKPAAEIAPTGNGKILVMDDEDLIRDVARDILNSLGYETELARDGAEALALFRRAKDMGKPYAAVIMDLTIHGGMGGEEAVKKLHAIDPDAKAIVSSGYSTGPIMSDFKAYGFSGVITKPYRIADMGATLQLVINSKSA